MEKNISSRILFEDNHIIVVDKPAGMLSQGDISGDMSLLDLLKKHVKDKYAKPGEAFMGLVHRLDRPVSGLMVYARTSKAASRLHEEITSGRMEKYYLALTDTKPVPAAGWHKLENYLVREKNITHIATKRTRNSQQALLHYSVISNGGGRGLFLIKLETGRKHQIRAQLSGMGCPVLGDAGYGSNKNAGRSICLHSVCLAFNHPVKKEFMEFYSTPPDSFMSGSGIDADTLKGELSEKIKAFRDQAFLSKPVPFFSGG